MLYMSLGPVRNAVLDHDLCSHGDLIIVLISSSARFALSNAPDETSSDQESTDSTTVDSSSSSESEEDESLHETDATNEQQEANLVSYRVCRQSVCHASPYFERKFTGPWLDGTQIQPPELKQVDAEEEILKWDPEALLHVLQMMHSNVLDIPHNVSLDLLGKIVLVASYFECTDLPRMFAMYWWDGCMDILRRSSTFNTDTGMLTASSMRAATICVFVSFTLRLPDVFKGATRTLVYRAPCPIENLGLPIDPSIIEALNDQRETRLGQVFNGRNSSNGECIHQVTMQQIFGWRLVPLFTGDPRGWPEHIQAPYIGYSLEKDLVFAAMADRHLGVFEGLAIDGV